jgi:hypothetical protein
MIQLKDIKEVVKFTGGMATKMQNAALNYKLPLPKVKSLYLEAVNEVVQSKQITEKDTAQKIISKFSSEEYRKIWFLFMEKCQTLVKSEGGSRKGAMTKLENKAQAIIDSDVRRLKVRIGKLNAKLQTIKTLSEKKEIREKIKKYEAFVEYTKTDRAINHFMNKVKLNPEMKSLIFKSVSQSQSWDVVVNI